MRLLIVLGSIVSMYSCTKKSDTSSSSASLISPSTKAKRIDFSRNKECPAQEFFYLGQGCYHTCQWDGVKNVGCLKADEIPSQIDETKKIKVCENPMDIIVDDLCQAPVFHYDIEPISHNEFILQFVFHGDISGKDQFIYRSRTLMNNSFKKKEFLGFKIGKYWQIDEAPYAIFEHDGIPFHLQNDYFKIAYQNYEAQKLKGTFVSLHHIAPKKSKVYGYNDLYIPFNPENPVSEHNMRNFKISFKNLVLEPFKNIDKYVEDCHKILPELFSETNYPYNFYWHTHSRRLEFKYQCALRTISNTLIEGFDKFPLNSLYLHEGNEFYTATNPYLAEIFQN